MGIGIWMKRMPKGMNKAAFRGNLNCPACTSTAVRFVETIGPYRLRYRCRKCGMPFQYETGRDLRTHPYAALKKNKFREIVESDAGAQQILKTLQGRKKRRY